MGMSKSAFDELFGEIKEVKEVKPCSRDEKGFKILLSFFLSVIVISLASIFSVFYLLDNNSENFVEVLGEKTSKMENQVSVETPLDRFFEKFTNGYYKVYDSGAFGYIYGDSENGVISLEEEPVYFKNGNIQSMNYSDDIKIFWDQFYRKFILFNEKKEYFIVNDSSDFYYRKYLGQHILQDFIDDYGRNKDFINKIDENTWTWEWSFYTPVNSLSKHSMEANIILDNETEYIKEIRIYNNSKKICVFEFSFENIEENLDIEMVLQDYSRIKEPDIIDFL